MKKQLNTTAVINELRGSSVFFREHRIAGPPSSTDTIHPQIESPQPPQETNADKRDRHTPLSSRPSTNPSTNRSTDPPTDEPTGESTALSTDRTTNNAIILGRPKAFYITEQQDHDLDVAVEKLTARLKGRVNQKIDRSTLMRLLLDSSDLTSDQLIDRLTGHFVSRLIRQLTS